MSMNKYMHPRNIYKNPPDFKNLAVKYPTFKKYVQLDVSGKATFDFKDPEALRALSSTLLKKDFDLDVDIPKTKLIPTIPLRLNYILWIEDLLSFMRRVDSVHGIDIGTGASCIYPLLAAKKNAWKMLATEKDENSLTYAKSNIEKNSLSELIDVVCVPGDSLLCDILNDSVEYDFCMCNPPFFSSTQELHPFFKSRTRNRPHPKNAFVATVNEVVAKGGEVEFIEKLMRESKELGDKVKLYTTMIGQKSDMPALKKILRELNVHSFKETTFCQGNTTRWGLAWTFCDYDLQKATDVVKQNSKTVKPKPPLILEVTNESVDSITRNVLEMFKGLKMTFEEVTRNKSHQRYFVSACSNTWSHQRRKRREKQRKSSEESCTIEEIKEEDQKSPGKRSIDDICESTSKKLRLCTDSDTNNEGVYFKFMFAVNSNKDALYLELNTLEDDNRENLHQILQYIKNNLDRQGGCA